MASPENLRSKDTIEVILGLCEGVISGLRSNKDFFIGNTPLENQGGQDNFTDFSLSLYPGVPSPAPLVTTLGSPATNNSQVGVVMATDTPIIRQTISGDINFIEFRIAVQRLFRQGETGMLDTPVTFRLEYKAASSGTWIKVYGADITINGHTSSTYVKEIRQVVSQIGEPYDLRVTKISEENTTKIFRDISWESFQEGNTDSRTYPNTAIVKLLVEATDQFSSIPTWSGIYDLMLVKIPTNYDPETREYTGIWDGSWQVAWTDNPAWCLYEFVMNDRFGIKSYYPEVNLDKYDVYDAAVWCDELVPDGQGGFQPRYTLNLYVTEPTPGKELARYIAGAFNATFFDDLNGKAFLRVDKDDPASHIFVQENVYDEGFEYSYTDMETRYNDITVSFINPDLDWNVDRRRVFDQDLIDKNGRIPLDFIAVGCTNLHEALRRGQYKLITANTETCIVRFVTNRLGGMVSPFDVILICDPDMGYGLSGRIKSINDDRDIITLRDPLYLEAGMPYEVHLPLTDGTVFIATIEDSTLGYNFTLKLSSVLPEDVVPVRSVFTLEHPTLLGTPRPFRVLKVEEVDGSPDRFTIEAININRNKWYDSDNLTDTGTIDYSVLPDPFDPPGPTSCTFLEQFVSGT